MRGSYQLLWRSTGSFRKREHSSQYNVLHRRSKHYADCEWSKCRSHSWVGWIQQHRRNSMWPGVAWAQEAFKLPVERRTMGRDKLYPWTSSIPELFVDDSLIENKALCSCESNARRRRSERSTQLLEWSVCSHRSVSQPFQARVEHTLKWISDSANVESLRWRTSFVASTSFVCT